MKKFFKSSLAITFAIIALLVIPNDLFSQCTNCGSNSNYPSGTFTTTSASWANITTCNWGGEFFYCNLNTSYMYQWMTCGDTDFDTQLTLYPSNTCANTSTTWHPGPYLLAYNDDACGRQSIINYHPGTTNVRVLVSEYYCTGNGSSSGCMTTQWRAIPYTPTISGGGATICAGGSTTLTASNIGNNDGYVSVYWGTTSGGTQVSSDATSVTVSPTSTTTYYCQYVLTPGSATTYSNVTSTTVTVNQPPTAPTGVSVTGGGSAFCSGESRTLTASGGSTGTSCTYQWYAGGCGSGSVLGTGASITVSPTSTTTYYVRRVGASPCANVTNCASTTLTVYSLSTTPSSINAVINP